MQDEKLRKKGYVTFDGQNYDVLVSLPAIKQMEKEFGKALLPMWNEFCQVSVTALCVIAGAVLMIDGRVIGEKKASELVEKELEKRTLSEIYTDLLNETSEAMRAAHIFIPEKSQGE
jgi:hypothetical protein